MAKVSFWQTIWAALRTIVKILPRILLFEIIYKLLTMVAFRPLLSFIMQLMLNLKGDPLAFNSQIWHFFLSVPGLIAIFLLVAIASILIYFEFAVIIILAYQTYLGFKISLLRAVNMAFLSLVHLFNPDIFGFSLYSLLLLPLVNAGLTSTLLPYLQLPNFLASDISASLPGAVLLTVAAVLLAVFFYRLLFTMPVMVLEQVNFFKAIKKGRRIRRSFGYKMIGVMLVFCLIWVALFLLPREIFTYYWDSPNVIIRDLLIRRDLPWIALPPLFLYLIISIVQAIEMPVLLSLLVVFYAPVGEPVQMDLVARERLDVRLDKMAVRQSKGRTRLLAFWLKLKKTMLGKAMILSAVAFGAVLVSNLIFSSAPVNNPLIIGHRGSMEGVENTIEAIQGAIDAGADYAEIDIRLAKDGVAMVFHDSSLRRLACVNGNVYDYTAAELQQLILRQNGYSGQVPTLAEVVAYCDGKIQLAIELKPHGYETVSIVDQVLAVVNTSAYQKDCFLFSLDYDIVSELKAKGPQHTVGYCVYGNIGTINSQRLRAMNIDFLLVEETMVSPKLVRQCRQSWIPVYVWTVNTAEDMMAHLKAGVLGLFTDYPALARQVVNSFR